MTNTTLPLVSVIIPAYNAGKYISETIKSVLKQTYSNIEIIIVDDGSTDDTVEKVNKFNDKVTLLTQKNKGVSCARNNAVSIAKGCWLAFIDADDLWLENKLELQINKLNKLNKLKWSHTNSFYFGENQSGFVTRSDLTKQYSGQVFSKLIINNFITTSTIIIKKELFLIHGGFDETLPALEDWQLWMNIAKSEPIHYIKEPLAHYRVYTGSTSRKVRTILPMHIRVINDIFKHMSISAENTQLKNLALSSSYEICSYIAEDACDWSFSFKCAINSCIKDPFNPRCWKRIIRASLNYFKQ